MGDIWPILAVSSPFIHTNFTWWVPGAASSAVKSVSSLFRTQRSLPCVFRNLNMSLAFFLCVSFVIMLIAVATVPIGAARVTP